MWDVDEAKWFEKFIEVKDFKEKHGHTQVTRSMHKQLFDWIIRQRFECEKEDRRKLLDSIGFVWDLYEAQWIEIFDELRDFKEKHGHAKVTRSMNKQLAHWVKRQRFECKREDRIKLLDSLGFV